MKDKLLTFIILIEFNMLLISAILFLNVINNDFGNFIADIELVLTFNGLYLIPFLYLIFKSGFNSSSKGEIK